MAKDARLLDSLGDWQALNWGAAWRRVFRVREYYLSQKQLARLEANLPDYQWAVELVGAVPALALAAVNYRETGGRRTVKRRGGWCQMDWAGATVQALQARAAKICRRYGVPAGKLATNFRTGCLVCAHILKLKSKTRPIFINGVVMIPHLAWALWAYNGRSSYHTPDGKRDRARRHWKFSPYVSNDPKRGVVLQLKGTVPGPAGKRIKIDRVDRRPGALVIYQELDERLGYSWTRV